MNEASARDVNQQIVSATGRVGKHEECFSESTPSMIASTSASTPGTPEAAHPFTRAIANADSDTTGGSSEVQWSFEALPDEFHKSPEPLAPPPSEDEDQLQCDHYPFPYRQSQNTFVSHQNLQNQNQNQNQNQIHLHQIQENAVCQEQESPAGLSPSRSMPKRHAATPSEADSDYRYFTPHYSSTRLFCSISKRIFQQEDCAMATWIGFWSLMVVTMGVSTITPIRDALALQVGVKHIPKLTLASSVLAFLSSVPIGWLFEAPDPGRRKLWKRMGLTRGETQGSSLALFYRFFALAVTSYAIGFTIVDLVNSGRISLALFSWLVPDAHGSSEMNLFNAAGRWMPAFLSKLGEIMYIAFFLVVHLMKLHSISLIWGVTTEAMEYEDVARKAKDQKDRTAKEQPFKTRTRLQRLALVGFGGTLGGIGGSILASQLVSLIHLPGLLILSAALLEVSAQLSTELGRIMQKHWEEQQIFRSTQDLAGLDASMKRSASLNSMKRVASGNSLMKRVSSGNSIGQSHSHKSLASLDSNLSEKQPSNTSGETSFSSQLSMETDDNTFTQRLLRGITTILRSRLLMAVFTYNALFASTTVLLSFQRAELVANRSPNETSIAADTAFLAKINMASSIAVFCMQASGIGAIIAQRLGSRGSLALMPVIRLLGVMGLAWWHKVSNGKPPNLILFLILDECTRVVNLAVAKPVRESLWRGLSNEARYEAKPIVDTLANRWGAGSASFCVSVISRIMNWIDIPDRTRRGEIAGQPPIIFLCLIVAAWWAMVSLDLGQIRRRIDLELKKRE